MNILPAPQLERGKNYPKKPGKKLNIPTISQWSYKFVKHAFKVEKLLFIQATSTFTTYKALFGEYGTSVQT